MTQRRRNFFFGVVQARYEPREEPRYYGGENYIHMPDAVSDALPVVTADRWPMGRQSC